VNASEDEFEESDDVDDGIVEIDDVADGDESPIDDDRASDSDTTP